MIVALMIGRAGSRGLPGKNTKTILGKSLCEFPLIACKKSKFVKKIFVSTDCPIIKKKSKKYGVEFIERPKDYQIARRWATMYLNMVILK